MKHFWYVFSAVVLWAASSAAQHTITIGATLLPDSKTVRVQQEIIFKNTSDGVLTEIYLNDWANSFSKKTTALAERFAENYDNQFHFEKEAKRGRTTIGSISYSNGAAILWDRGKAEDIIHFNLKDPLPPGKSVS
ncbi:MAG: metalloprotease, partial [Marinirhabdus sp.]